MFSLGCILVALGTAEPTIVFTPQEQRRILQHSPVPPPPDDPTNAWDQDERAARFGQALFFDAGFSSSGTISCVSCHSPMLGFTDGRALPEGLGPGTRHAPSLLNVAHQRWFFWDGRADTLWSQALHPIEHPLEFGSTRIDYVHRLHDEPAYRQAYEELFGPLPSMDETRFPAGAAADSPTWLGMSGDDRDAVNTVITNCAKAIAAYEVKLHSGGSAFDIFVEGLRTEDQDKQAVLPPGAKRGLKLFVGEAGCRQCHSGPLFTDFEFHNIGIPAGDGATPRDPGRHQGIIDVQASTFSAHGPYSDQPNGPRARRTASTVHGPEHWGAFKTPSLRNLTRTAPYMHQGQFTSIEEVLAYYNTLDEMVVQDHHQETVLQPLELSPAQLADLAAFLRSLESPLPDRSLLGVPSSPMLEQEPTAAPPKSGIKPDGGS